MIRPRTGDFLYTPAEYEVMMDDVRTFKSLGADGIVFGVLQADGWLDVDRTRQLAEEAHGMQGESGVDINRSSRRMSSIPAVCFHRAFDMTPTPENDIDENAPLNQLIQIPNITRILTR